MSIPADHDSPITLEESKRRLAERLGVSRETLRTAGYVRRLRDRGCYLAQQRTLTGGVKLSCFRLRPSVVDAVAEEILSVLPRES